MHLQARYHALLLVMLAAGACGAPIPFESTYRLPESSVPDAWTVLADNTAINGTLLRTTTAASELACSAACREAAPACSMFEYCGVQVGARRCAHCLLGYSASCVGIQAPALAPPCREAAPTAARSLSRTSSAAC